MGGPAKPKGTASGRPALPDGLTSEVSQGQKATRAAEKVRTAAVQRISDAWRGFAEEVNVQKLVWQSIIQVNTMKKGDQDLAKSIEGLKSTLDSIVAMSAQNGTDALRSLGLILAPGAQRQHLGNGLQKAARNVFEQDGAAADRRLLADKLEEAANPRFTPASGAARFELEDLLTKCKLEDAQLERRIRQALQLPAPASIELGGAAKAEPTWSQFSGISSVWDGQAEMKPVSKKSSSRRSQSMGSSTKAQYQNSGGNTFGFDPGKRIIQAL